MDILYHRTSALVEELHRNFSRLERAPVEKCPDVERDIQLLLDTVSENIAKLDILVNKEVPSRRVGARVQVDQLKYDTAHYQTSLQNAIHRRLQREQESRDREELLSTRFQSNASAHRATATTTAIDMGLQHHSRMQGAHRGVDDLLGQGGGILQGLREQRGVLKGARTKALDLVNTLGLSNTVMRLIEKRAHQDKYVLVAGMVVTCVVMVLVVKYLT